MHGRARVLAAFERENAIRAASFSQRLRILMESREETQKSVGCKLGVAQSAVFGWLNGTLPRGGELARLAAYFHVSLDWLVNGTRKDGSQLESPYLPPVYVARVRALAGAIKESGAEIEQLTDRWATPTETKFLPKVPYSEILAPVRHETMDRLLEAARRLTRPRGQKKALADALGVSPSRVSEWLAGDCMPDGDRTLRLLNWVERQEAQQTKRPAGGTTPTGLKTRKKEPNEKNLKSDPP